MLLLQNSIFRTRIVLLLVPSTPTPTPHHHLFRLITSISKKSNFTLDYLINSCGLSPESALKVSKKIDLKSPTRPDSVLSLLKAFHIPKPHISKLITCYPRMLLSHPNNTIKPKLQFLSNLGMSGPDLGKFLIRNTTASLKNQIIPGIDFFKGFVHTNSNVLKLLNSLKWISQVKSSMGPNIAFLRYLGVTDSDISKFMITRSQHLCTEPGLFKETKLELEKMGISHSDSMFMYCLTVRLAMKKPIWDAKLAAYMNFGWSENDVFSMFKRQPFIMAISEKKINSGMHFLMNDLNLTLPIVASNPSVLLHSLEKRVIPRSHLLQTLLSMDLISKDSVCRALKLTEDAFVKKYVIKYNDEVPNLLKLYQSKRSGRGLLTEGEGEWGIQKNVDFSQ